MVADRDFGLNTMSQEYDSYSMTHTVWVIECYTINVSLRPEGRLHIDLHLITCKYTFQYYILYNFFHIIL